jgi:RHH-type proline utilization regulon transcriptional repressor/proline dehydrogenase/delta 1-pyrroline-5-carboxylate dehydrogenase
MGEAIHAAIVSLGYPVRIYTPIGELIPGMAYLVRRLLENASNESFLRQEFFQERSAEDLLKAPVVSHPVAATHEEWAGEPLLDFAQETHRARMAQSLGALRGKLGQTYSLLLGADEVATASTLIVRNPSAPSEVVGRVSQASLVEVNRAVQLAGTAQPLWARTPARGRVACLRRAARLICEQREALAAWEVLEVGKTWREADADVVEAIDYVEYYSQCMMDLEAGKPLRQVPGERNTYTYVPRGVAVVIAPWNFPAAILTGMASAALVTGNAVILKPAGQSSVIALHLAQILRASGIPPDIIQCLPGLGEEVGAALVRHPGTHVVLFTGSKAVGMSIIEACAQVLPGHRFIKHVVAEMGGKNAIVVDADADLDAAISGTLRSAFGYGGQKCSAASRVIVLDAVYDRFLTRLVSATDRLVVGDPADPGTDVGPLIDAAAQQRLLEAIARVQRVGALAYQCPVSRIPPQGYFVGPAIATEVPHQDPLATEELFGPLLCVFRVPTFEEAIALANDTDYALTGGVYSRSPSHLEEARRSFDVGNLYLNRPITGAIVGRQPFGGYKLSGLGTKAGGPDYLLHLTLPKTICENTTRHGMPLD